VSAGDAIGFPAGTGVAHTFINDSNAGDSELGEELVLWIFGENKIKKGEMWFYPLNPELQDELEKTVHAGGWWHDCPKHELGPHPGKPTQPFQGTLTSD